MKKALLILCFFVVLTGSFVQTASGSSAIDAGPSPKPQAVPRKTVLILFPNQPDLPQTKIAEQTIRDEFNKVDDLSLDLFVEYLYLNRFSGEAEQQQVADLLVKRYHDTNIDLVIMLNDSSLLFWEKFHEEILPTSTPLILYGITPKALARHTLLPEMTGISALLQDHKETLDWYLRIRPNTKEIVLIHGVGQADEEFVQGAEELREAIGDKAELVDWSDLSLEEIKTAAAKLPNNAVILYELMFEDAAGVNHRPFDALTAIVDSASVPVLSGYAQYIGSGTIGGSMYSIETQSQMVTQIGLRILHGEDPNSIPFTNTQNTFIFDHLALRRWGIPLSDLPEGSLIKNQQYSFWEIYQDQIILSFVGIAALVAFIIVLSVVNHRLSRARKALSHLNDNLEAQVVERTTDLRKANAALEADIAEREAAEAEQERLLFILESSLNEIYIYLPDTLRIEYANQTVLENLGYSIEELRSLTPADIDPDFSEEKVRELIAPLLSGKVGKLVFQTKHQRKDLTCYPVEVLLQKVSRANEDRFLAIINDITERKAGEEQLKLTNSKLNTLVNELEKNNRNAGIIQEMDGLLQICATTGEAYQVVQQYGPRLFPNTSGALFLFDGSRKNLEAFAIWGSELHSELVFPSENCWTMRLGQFHQVREKGTGLRCQHMFPEYEGEYLGIPMIASGELMGMLQIENNAEAWESANIEKLATTLAEHLSLSLSNIKLREKLKNQSVRDALTGLFNRRFMDESLELEIHHARRSETTVGVIMLDIDHFKDINDEYGHETGDVVLSELGKLLRDFIRGGDIACRFGGEEFILIMPETGLETLAQRAEEIRQAVKNITITNHHRHSNLITVSCGIAVFPTHGDTAQELLSQADRALYQAKHNGRDQVEFAGGMTSK